MRKIDCYALLVYNSKVNTTRLIGLYDTRSIAEDMLKVQLEQNFYQKKYKLYVQECTLSLKKKLISEDLIDRCYNIANCLYLADRCLKRRQFDRCYYWHTLAIYRSCSAAFLLHDDI